MEIRILGAHNLESAQTKLTSLLVDNRLALDAGGLTSSLSLAAQGKLLAVFLTHYHFDHIRDIAGLGLATAFTKTTPVYATSLVLEALTTHLINGQLYPNFFQWPPEKPSLVFHPIEPLKTVSLERYTILPLPVSHGVPTIGFLVTRNGKSLFYTGDTGPAWHHAGPMYRPLSFSSPRSAAPTDGRKGWARPGISLPAL